MNFNGFHPLTTLFFFGACCKQGSHLNTSTAQSSCIPASYCHLSATLQTMSIIVVNLQDNQAVFRIFITLLRFSFASPSYHPTYDSIIKAQCSTILKSKHLMQTHKAHKTSIKALNNHKHNKHITKFFRLSLQFLIT
jgi:hypothetical protein